MRVAIPVLALPTSGGARITLQYAAGLAERGHAVTLLLPEHRAADCDRYADYLHRIHLGWVSVPAPLRHRGYAPTVLALGWAVPDCDIILSNSWQTIYPSLLAKLRHRHAKLIYLIQSDDVLIERNLSDASYPKRLRNWLLAELAYRVPARRLVVSRWVEQSLRRRGLPTVYLPNGIDLGTFYPREPTTTGRAHGDTFDVLWLARITRVKGSSDMLAAMQIVCRRLPQARLIVVANTPIRVPDSIPSMHVAVTSDATLRLLYQQCGVFVFPSRAEGFGLPPLEAMACGAPVVTTDCGGVRDYAVDGENCLMVPVGQPDQIAAAILRLNEDQSLAARLAENGRRTALLFDIRRSVERLDVVLRTAAGQQEEAHLR